MARQPVGQGQQVLGHGGKAAHLLALRGDDAGRHPLLVHVQPAAPLVNGIPLPAPSVDGCRPAGDRRTRDFTMRALRRGGATFLDAWRSPRQFPARARSANDGRPSRRPAPPHFHPLRWPSQGHGISGESRNPRTPQLQPPRRSGRQPNQSQKSPKSNESQFKTKRPPPVTTPPPPPVFPAKAGTHAPSPPSVYPIPTSRRRRHAPHPSFRRKPESTSPPNRNSLEGPGGNQTSPENHSNQTNHSSRPSAPHQSPHNHPHPSFQRNPQPAPPPHLPYTQYPRVAVDATPPIRLSGERRNLRHPPTATPSKVRAATKPIPKITQIKRITVQDQAPPTSHHTTPPTRLSGESRNLRHPPTATPSKVRTATKPIPKITQIKRITVQDQAPPTSHHTTTPPVFPPNPEPNSTLPTPNSKFSLTPPTSQPRIHLPTIM